MLDVRLKDAWYRLLDTWKVLPSLAAEMLADVWGHYAGPGRFYHTLAHVQAVLETVDSLTTQAQDPSTLHLAAWLHDVIYISRAADNEERSADYAERWCGRLIIPGGKTIASLILKTKTHDAGSYTDAQILIDADLAIPGASEAAYQAYAANIRREYAWVTEQEYRVGRRAVLEAFLDRPRIFRLLPPARRNMAAEIELLTINLPHA